MAIGLGAGTQGLLSGLVNSFIQSKQQANTQKRAKINQDKQLLLEKPEIFKMLYPNNPLSKAVAQGLIKLRDEDAAKEYQRQIQVQQIKDQLGYAQLEEKEKEFGVQQVQEYAKGFQTMDKEARDRAFQLKIAGVKKRPRGTRGQVIRSIGGELPNAQITPMDEIVYLIGDPTTSTETPSSFVDRVRKSYSGYEWLTPEIAASYLNKLRGNTIPNEPTTTTPAKSITTPEAIKPKDTGTWFEDGVYVPPRDRSHAATKKEKEVAKKEADETWKKHADYSASLSLQNDVTKKQIAKSLDAPQEMSKMAGQQVDAMRKTDLYKWALSTEEEVGYDEQKALEDYAVISYGKSIYRFMSPTAKTMFNKKWKPKYQENVMKRYREIKKKYSPAITEKLKGKSGGSDNSIFEKQLENLKKNNEAALKGM